MSTVPATAQEWKAESLQGWKKAGVHTVVCPSGVAVEIRIPDLPAMIEAGEIPQHLLDAALGVATGEESQKPTIELIKQQREFTDNLVRLTVVKPALSEGDLKEVPYEDKEFLVSVATRQRDLDAIGEHIGGLTKYDKFRRFRGLEGVDETVEGA